MAIAHRLRRLERQFPVAGGCRPCRVCANGTHSTGTLVRFEGVDQGPRPAPCPGCGRDEPTVINYLEAVPPPGWSARKAD
jgi:hypothetical protein